MVSARTLEVDERGDLRPAGQHRCRCVCASPGPWPTCWPGTTRQQRPDRHHVRLSELERLGVSAVRQPRGVRELPGRPRHPARTGAGVDHRRNPLPGTDPPPADGDDHAGRRWSARCAWLPGPDSSTPTTPAALANDLLAVLRHLLVEDRLDVDGDRPDRPRPARCVDPTRQTVVNSWSAVMSSGVRGGGTLERTGAPLLGVAFSGARHLLASLDATIVAVGIDTLVEEFDASVADIQWVTTAFCWRSSP